MTRNRGSVAPEYALLGSANEMTNIRLKTRSVKFHYLPEWQEKSEEEKTFASRHYFNVVRWIDFKLEVLK